MRLPLLLFFSFLALTCHDGKTGPSEDSLEEAVNRARVLIAQGDAGGLADLYEIQERKGNQNALRFARDLLREVPGDGFLLRDLKISGNLGVVLLADTRNGPPYLAWARWRDGQWKFFPSFTIWGHTEEIEDFGLSEKEMDNAYKLELWALAQVHQNR